MMQFETETREIILQRRLDCEAVGTMAVVGGEETFDVARANAQPGGLSFGPYGASPISGLHFDTADDTAAS